jgi:phosphohistidine phosphatase
MKDSRRKLACEDGMASDSEESVYELCIMRHGIAPDRGSYPTDAKRPLTSEGKERMREIAQGLGKAGFSPDRIVSSPLVRASETAEIVAEILGSGVRVESCDALQPGGTREALFDFLAKQSAPKAVLVVGHEPDLSELAASLLGAGHNHDFALKKGGCCLISFDRFPPKAAGRLVWWLTPRILRKLA